MPDTIDDLKQQIRQLDALQASGALPEEAARSARAALEKRLLDLVLASPGGAARGASAAEAAPAQARPTPSRRLVASLVLFVAAFGAAGTWWLGSRDGWNTAPGALPPAAPTGAAAAPDDSASSPHSMTVAQIQGMVDTLAARMKNEPDNAEGWLMLGRSYAVLGQFEPAVAAYRHVLQLQPKNAQALADLADALAASSDQRFEGEPARLVEQALAAEPNNLKALLLAGTVAFDKKDYPAAIKAWERAEKAGPADNALVRQAGENLAEVRQLAGLPAAPPAPANPVAAAIGASVSGRVELAPALAAQAAPDDTVFVFARAAEGPRMPLAILKKKVRDLPLDFTLDDSLAMSPQARLSQVPRVVVGARVSKSGQAMPQPGDLEGLSDPVAPGTQGLKLTIGKAVP
ncbi:MAG: tetratricopeptide repeat protein [Burkholderiaceae bacterium]